MNLYLGFIVQCMNSYTFIPKVFSLLLFGFLIVSGCVLMGLNCSRWGRPWSRRPRTVHRGPSDDQKSDSCFKSVLAKLFHSAAVIVIALKMSPNEFEISKPVFYKSQNYEPVSDPRSADRDQILSVLVRGLGPFQIPVDHFRDLPNIR